MRLTKKGFVEWLRGKKSNQTVGYPRARTICPLSNYLSIRVGSYCHVTGAGWYAEGSRDTIHRNPKWAINFVADVDSTSELVTAKRALALLGEK